MMIVPSHEQVDGYKVLKLEWRLRRCLRRPTRMAWTDDNNSPGSWVSMGGVAGKVKNVGAQLADC